MAEWLENDNPDDPEDDEEEASGEGYVVVTLIVYVREDTSGIPANEIQTPAEWAAGLDGADLDDRGMVHRVVSVRDANDSEIDGPITVLEVKEQPTDAEDHQLRVDDARALGGSEDLHAPGLEAGLRQDVQGRGDDPRL